jgi:hypothetical protein
MKRFLFPILLIVIGVGLMVFLPRNGPPASISQDVSLGEVLKFTGPVSLRARPYTDDLELPTEVLGAQPAYAGYTFRDATKTLYRYDVLLFYRGEGRGPQFETTVAAAVAAPAPPAAGAAPAPALGWMDRGGLKVCLLPMGEKPFKYASGKTVRRRLLFFEHPSKPVDVAVIETLLVDQKDPPQRIAVEGADLPERLPEPGIALEDAAGAFASVIQ